MKRFIVCSLATLGTLALIVTIVVLWAGRSFIKSVRTDPVADPAILSLHIGDYWMGEDDNPEDRVPFFGRPENASLKQLLKAISYAKSDSKIKGILLVVEGNTIGLAQIQELRDAFKRFRKSGKFIYAFTETFGEFGEGIKGYYLSTAADKIWLQPRGMVGCNGLMIEIPFAKEGLEEWGIQPRIYKGKDNIYKSAPETFTQSDFTKPAAKNLQAITDQSMAIMIKDMAKDRNLSVSEMQNLVDHAPHLYKTARKKKLVDHLGYLDTVKKYIRNKLGKSGVYYSAEAYLNRKKQRKKPKEMIALIYLEGDIKRSRRSDGELTGDFDSGNERIAKAIRQAVCEKRVKAIILRVNSGGGSAIASETIWHEVRTAVAKKKPVIVSMSDVAASGAYLIACPATKIVAHPLTLTGSIGVYVGKFLTKELWDNLGVHWGQIKSGKNAGMWSSGKDFSEDELKKIQEITEDIYTTFKAKVAKGRNLPIKTVDALSKGRVWTGLKAKEHKLVDALGGMPTAIRLAKESAKIPMDKPMLLETFPKEKAFSEKLYELLRDSERGIIAGVHLVQKLNLILNQLSVFEKATSQHALKEPFL